MAVAKWHKLGAVADLQKKELQHLAVAGRPIALSFRNNQFGAIAGSCLHVGGPLGKGCLRDDYVVCPWHHWMFHRLTGEARPGIPAAVPRYELKEEAGQLCINLAAVTQAKHAPHPPHPLARNPVREPGVVRVAGISTTAMNRDFPRRSTSDFVLETALQHAQEKHSAETRLIRLNDLQFRSCEGYYSKSAQACTWPCTITQQDPADELDRVYETFVFWADVILIGTPIRWGNASALYYKMVERMNCIQNQITISDRVLIRNKVAAFIILGGQDNIQAVAGQMLTFFGELGFSFPQFPFIAHSRGWTAEDMENNVEFVCNSTELREGAHALVDRSLVLARSLIENDRAPVKTDRGGRKAHPV